MVRTARKFVVSPLRAVVLVGTAIILLSVPAVESRRCYWCGPLAEQVHRSRRAPSCGAPGDHTTTCEPDLSHCAVVATAPPYVESRYCVKLYQDECYSLFCNTTRTWRMTCPCRGDLCNGPNTDRETEAFNVLKTLANKTRLMKRAIISLGKVVDPDNESSDIPTNMISSTMIWDESSQNHIDNRYNDQETKATEISLIQSSINASIVSKDENTDEKQNNETESNFNNPDVKSDDEMQSDEPVEDPENESGSDKIEETENSNPYKDINTSTKNPNMESILSSIKTTEENQKHEETETPTNQPNSLNRKSTGVLPTAKGFNENTTVAIEKNINLPTTGKTPNVSTLPNTDVTLVPSIPSKNVGNSISVSLILLTYCTTFRYFLLILCTSIFL